MEQKRKKVLIITYYWPPSGGAGVQRWLKFAKYLENFGWEPIVYTPKNNEIPVYDASLEKDIPENIKVIKKNIWEPYNIYKRFLGASKEEKFNIGGFISENKNYGLKDKLATAIRGNFFIPDARIFWVKPSFRFLRKYLKENPVDVVVTTGPPHSMHLIGHRLKRKMNIKWIADFRDPWTKIFFYKDLMLTKYADKKHKMLERKVLQAADHVLTVGWTLQKELIELGAKNVSVITNGYDEDDFQNIENIERNGFCITQTGNISRSKNSPEFWKAISELCGENNNFKNELQIRLAGKLDITVHEIINHYNLENKVEKLGYITHEDVIKEQKSANILVLMTTDTEFSKSAIPGRTFEYIAAKRPVIAIANPQSDLARVINESDAGNVIDYGEKEKIKNSIMKYYQSFKDQTTEYNISEKNKYSRENLTEQLSHLLKKVSEVNK